MGKGIPAALVGIALKIELQRFAALTVCPGQCCDKGQLWQEDLLSPEKIVRYTDEAISPQLMQSNISRHSFTGVLILPSAFSPLSIADFPSQFIILRSVENANSFQMTISQSAWLLSTITYNRMSPGSQTIFSFSIDWSN